MSTQELIDRLREKGITVTTDNGNLKIRADNPEAVKPVLPELKQNKTDIIAYLNETEKEMQAEIALFHGEAVAFIARHIRTQYGKTYWQAQGEALTVWNILRRNQIKQAVKEGRDDAAERLLQECREKFGMPDYLATARAACRPASPPDSTGM